MRILNSLDADSPIIIDTITIAIIYILVTRGSDLNEIQILCVYEYLERAFAASSQNDATRHQMIYSALRIDGTHRERIRSAPSQDLQYSTQHTQDVCNAAVLFGR